MENMSNTTHGDDQSAQIKLVNLLNKTISEYGLGLIMLIGNFGSIFTCAVFSQSVFRKSPCAIYFFAGGFSQFFTFNFALFTRMLQYGYDFQALNYILWYCKIRFYFFYIFVAVPRYCIIIASVDRYFASSRDANRRQWSSSKNAFRVLLANVIFWSILYIQVIVFYNIDSGRCTYQSGVYGVFFSFYIAIDSGILPLLLMLVFGLLTVRNVHQTKKRVEPTAGVSEARGNQAGRMSKKDAQLHRMLANQIVLFMCLNLPNPIYLVYSALTISNDKSPLQQAIETFASNMTYVLVYLGFSLTFLNFFVSSEIFRREFLLLIRTKVLRRTPPVTTIADGSTVQTLRPNYRNEQ